MNHLKTSDCSELPVYHPTGEYRVYVGYQLLDKIGSLSNTQDHVALVTDTNVGPLYAQKAARQWDDCTIITIPAGESHKTLESVRFVYEEMLAAGCDRQTTVVALGGGVVNDLAGFVAATFMRGVRFVTSPTTLLSIVDASVGGKTGVDLPEGKNLVGAFKQPEAVIADLSLLKSLKPEEFASGMAEAIKHGILNAPKALPEILRKKWGAELRNGFSADDQLAFQQLICDVVTVKRDVVQRDPFEHGERALLNLGHTFGHAIEQVTGYQVRHGEAVAMGLVCSANLSHKLGYCEADLQVNIEEMLEQVSLPTRIPRLDPEELLSAMQMDKKKKGKKLKFILMRGIEEVFIADDVSDSDVMETLVGLMEGH
ncbi:MAG: 3-dehydroquinate synthase [Anaerolineae bacterium]